MNRSDLGQEEKDDARDRAAIGPRVVHEAVAQEGRDELERPPSALAWSGLAAGLSMGFSLVGEGVLRAIGLEGTVHSFGLMFLRGGFAAWLIALMVWLLPAAEHNRFHIVVVITWLVGVGGFAHIVAGSTEVFYLAWQGLMGVSAVVLEFLIPTLLGNIVGGVSLVAMLNHQQVHSGS